MEAGLVAGARCCQPGVSNSVERECGLIRKPRATQAEALVRRGRCLWQGSQSPCCCQRVVPVN